MVARVEANAEHPALPGKAAERAANAQDNKNRCKYPRPGKSLHMSAALHMSETLQMWLQMSANPAANIRGPANVVNFANIRDKKRLRVLAEVRRRFLGWRVSDMKKGREISRP